MINIRFAKENLLPKKETLLNIVFVTISALLVRFILNLFGVYILVGKLPMIFKLLIIIGLAIYIKSILEVKAFGREWI